MIWSARLAIAVGLEGAKVVKFRTLTPPYPGPPQIGGQPPHSRTC